MKIRTRVLGAAAALVMALTGALALAPGANAVVYAKFVQNPDATVTVTYPAMGDYRLLLLCDPSFTATDLSQCNLDTFSYALTTMDKQLPSSPALIFAGMPASSRIHEVPLPAGHFTMVFVYSRDGDPTPTWHGGAQNMNVGVLDTTTSVIPPWVQSVGRFSADSCPAGWDASWQQWAVAVTGGYVCTREVPSLG